MTAEQIPVQQVPVQRVLVVAAHPDDADFGSAGTIASWTDAGLEVFYCIVTDVDAGGFDHDVPRSAIGGIRQDEQRKAAATLGVTDVEFLGYSDGRLTVSFELPRYHPRHPSEPPAAQAAAVRPPRTGPGSGLARWNRARLPRTC